ncbi:helix-turn-helix domain-containing protein [Nonomuraea sp. AD125B]|uniref:helix-turn-helix domain-containing protein n=1 Tax=Nonomuraea sp. AD125B TaxID=3242897 RepID=UPI0035290EDE
MRLIETLVGIRRQRGLTQSDVAERMGRSQPAVSGFERLGGQPSFLHHPALRPGHRRGRLPFGEHARRSQPDKLHTRRR